MNINENDDLNSVDSESVSNETIDRKGQHKRYDEQKPWSSPGIAIFD
jgi:hypothetical protein